MASNTLKIKLENIDTVENLISLLNIHANDLPAEVMKAVKDIESLSEIDSGYLKRKGFNSNNVLSFVDGEKSKLRVKSVCKALKRLTVYVEKNGSKIRYTESVYPESYQLKQDDHVICEWG